LRMSPSEIHAFYQRYLRRIDASVRRRARIALGELSVQEAAAEDVAEMSEES